jgi:predicted anti-sigma-YlaC factor YlaD
VTEGQALSCREATELVTEAMEGALSEAMRARFEEHLDRCAACRTFARQMAVTVEVLRMLRRA